MTQLLIILVIVVLVFGTKKLKNIGSDLGGALKGFKSAMSEDEEKAKNTTQSQIPDEKDTFDVKAEKVDDPAEEKQA